MKTTSPFFVDVRYVFSDFDKFFSGGTSYYTWLTLSISHTAKLSRSSLENSIAVRTLVRMKSQTADPSLRQVGYGVADSRLNTEFVPRHRKQMMENINHSVQITLMFCFLQLLTPTLLLISPALSSHQLSLPQAELDPLGAFMTGQFSSFSLKNIGPFR